MQEIRLLNLQKTMRISRFKRGFRQAILLWLDISLLIGMICIRHFCTRMPILYFNCMVLAPIWIFLLFYTVFKWFIRQSVYERMEFDRELENLIGVKQHYKMPHIIRKNKMGVVDFYEYKKKYITEEEYVDPEERLAEILLEELEKNFVKDKEKAGVKNKVLRQFVRMLFW